MALIEAGNVGDVPAGRVKLVVDESEDVRIAVCNLDGQFFAIEDVCTHDGGPLDQGDLEGSEIECPRHGARFDVTTGRATCMPAVVPVKTYEVRLQDGEVQVNVP